MLQPAGTTSNEALHAEIKKWFSQTQQIHQSTLALKLRILLFAKMLPHHASLQFPTLSQMTSNLLLSRVVNAPVWSAAVWQTWCKQLSSCDFVHKADLPLVESRDEERAKVKTYARKKPAHVAKPTNLKRKRTVFTQERRHSLRRQGAKLTG